MWVEIPKNIFLDLPDPDLPPYDVYIWDKGDCEENCWRSGNCELLKRYYELLKKLTKRQIRLTDNPAEARWEYQHSLEEFRENLRKMEKHYKQGWEIKKNSNKSWVRSLEYKK